VFEFPALFTAVNIHPPPETVHSCVVILYGVDTLLLENYGPLYRTPDRVSFFPFGQLGTISIQKGVLHLFGTISSSYIRLLFPANVWYSVSLNNCRPVYIQWSF
jgi:hypothetical protein